MGKSKKEILAERRAAKNRTRRAYRRNVEQWLRDQSSDFDELQQPFDEWRTSKGKKHGRI